MAKNATHDSMAGPEATEPPSAFRRMGRTMPWNNLHHGVRVRETVADHHHPERRQRPRDAKPPDWQPHEP